MSEEKESNRPKKIRFNGRDRPIYYLKGGSFHIWDNSGGIYVLVCLETGSAYVGSSKNIEHRVRSHLRQLKNRTHTNPKLTECFRNNRLIWGCILLDAMPGASEIDRLIREKSYVDNPLFDLNIQRSDGLERVIQRKLEERAATCAVTA